MDRADQEGKVDELILEATYNNFQDKYKNKYYEADKTTLLKEYKKLAKAWGTIEGFLAHIEPMLNTIKPIKIEALKHPPYRGAIPVYHIGDPHLGKMETEKVIQRLATVAEDIKKEKSKDVYINCLGDIFETLVSGGMHV